MRFQPNLRRLSRMARVLAVPIAAVALPLTLSSTALASTPAAHTWTVQAGSQSSNMAIQSMAFLPANVYVDAGDSVRWRANSAEPHTVTFLAAGQTFASLEPFNPGNPLELLKQGSSVYDGTSYYNSGMLMTVKDAYPFAKSYRLTFPTAGNYTYYCLVHGMAMIGVVHVRAAGTPYPFTQAQYNKAAAKAEARLLRNGRALTRETEREARGRKVIEGADNGKVMVMRFIRKNIVVRLGQTVTFVNNGMGAPHTVTFGKEPANPTAPLGNPANFRGGQLSSGFALPGSTFKVTFNKVGNFHYICALHDYMGMVGNVKVVRAPHHHMRHQKKTKKA